MTFDSREIQANFRSLSENSYVGRGFVVGLDESGNMIQVYWLMGRSAGSRNRVFDLDEGRVFTKSADGSVPDNPELTLYNAMDERRCGYYVVSNGAQTDDLCQALKNRVQHAFRHTLLRWSYEPDPNHTPRITAVAHWMGNRFEVEMALLRKSATSDDCDRAWYMYGNIPLGTGYCMTTYMGDGDPLPSFRGEPYLMPLNGTGEQIASTYWAALNRHNRVALVVKTISIRTANTEVHVINAHEMKTASTT